MPAFWILCAMLSLTHQALCIYKSHSKASIGKELFQNKDSDQKRDGRDHGLFKAFFSKLGKR